eukprot:3498204-Pleurochrysis_carterae.AAC.1
MLILSTIVMTMITVNCMVSSSLRVLGSKHGIALYLYLRSGLPSAGARRRHNAGRGPISAAARLSR